MEFRFYCICCASLLFEFLHLLQGKHYSIEFKFDFYTGHIMRMYVNYYMKSIGCSHTEIYTDEEGIQSVGPGAGCVENQTFTDSITGIPTMNQLKFFKIPAGVAILTNHKNA